MINNDFNVGNRLREVRSDRGLSQRQLAERAGVPHGQISMIERNHSSPSVTSLRKILSGIPMSMAEFFQPDGSPEARDQVVYTPSELLDVSADLSKSGLATPSGELTLRQVGDAWRHNLQILREVYAPGADTGENLLQHESTQGGIVVSGEIELTVGEKVYHLRAGDSFIFDSRQPHRFRNVSGAASTLISACTPPYL